MKRILSFVIVVVLIFSLQSVFAGEKIESVSKIDSVEVEYLEDGSRYVTVIESIPTETMSNGHIVSPLSVKTETKSKIAYYENSSGTRLWYVKVTGTFTYGNGTSKCTSVTPSAASNHSSWKVSDISGSKSGNKASATATGKQYADGKLVQSVTRTVTLTCSATGVFS